MKISLGSWAFSFGPFADNPIPFEKTVKRLSDAVASRGALADPGAIDAFVAYARAL